MTFHFAQDSWFSKFHTSDKLYHLFGSGLLFAVLWFIFFLNLEWSELWVAVMAFSGGLLVEIIDGFGEEGFSWKDLAMDFAGVVGMWLVVRVCILFASGMNLFNL